MGRSLQVICALALAAVLNVISASAAPVARSPIIFIPGTLGSILVNDKGEQIWGGLFSTRRHFAELAYPLSDPYADKVVATRLLDEFTVFGPFGMDGYDGIMGFLSSSFQLGKTYFEFPYNWRQTNFFSACQLKSFIDRNPNIAAVAKSEQGIVLMGHSMGGIVARLFMASRAPEGTLPTINNLCPHQYNVSLFISIATPFHGAGKALYGFTEGLGDEWKILQSDQNLVRRVFYSMPSVYELLPRYARCCEQVTGGRDEPIDALSFANWEKFGWIPAELNSPEGRDFIRARLSDALRIQQIMNQPLPDRTRVIFVAGAGLETQAHLTMQMSGEHRWEKWPEGDETVPLVSTTLNGIFPVVFPKSHLELLNSQFVRNQLRREIDATSIGLRSPGALKPEDNPPFNRIMRVPTMMRGPDAEASAVRVDFPTRYFASTSLQSVNVSILNPAGQPLSSIDANAIVATVQFGKNQPVRSRVTLSNTGYAVEIRTPVGPERGKLRIELPGAGASQGEFVEFFSVLPP